MRYLITSMGHAISPTAQDKNNGWKEGLPRMQDQMTGVLKTHGSDKTGSDVWNWMSTTQKDGVTFLNRLRAGEDILPEICDRINQEYGVAIEYSQFLDHFNAICDISENALTRLQEMDSFCEENDMILLAASHTNIYNNAHIENQCGSTLAKGRIVKVTSFEYSSEDPSKVGDHGRIIQAKLNELGFNPERDQLFSFVNTVKPELSSCPIGVVYKPLAPGYSVEDFKTVVREHFGLSEGPRPSV